MSEMQYTKLSSAQIEENKKLVISEYSKGGFTLAQQITTKDNGKKLNVYLKGAIRIKDLSGLYNLRDALNVAIGKIEQNETN